MAGSRRSHPHPVPLHDAHPRSPTAVPCLLRRGLQSKTPSSTRWREDTAALVSHEACFYEFIRNSNPNTVPRATPPSRHQLGWQYAYSTAEAQGDAADHHAAAEPSFQHKDTSLVNNSGTRESMAREATESRGDGHRCHGERLFLSSRPARSPIASAARPRSTPRPTAISARLPVGDWRNTTFLNHNLDGKCMPLYHSASSLIGAIHVLWAPHWRRGTLPDQDVLGRRQGAQGNHDAVGETCRYLFTVPHEIDPACWTRSTVSAPSWAVACGPTCGTTSKSLESIPSSSFIRPLKRPWGLSNRNDYGFGAVGWSAGCHGHSAPVQLVQLDPETDVHVRDSKTGL